MTNSPTAAPTVREHSSWILSVTVLVCSVIVFFVVVLIVRMTCFRGGNNREAEIDRLTNELAEERRKSRNLQSRMSFLEVEAEGRKSVNLPRVLLECESEGQPGNIPGAPVRRAETPPASAPPIPLYKHHDISLDHLYVGQGNADIPGDPGIMPGHRGSAIIGMSIDISAGDVTPVTQVTPISVMIYDASQEEIQHPVGFGGGLLEPQPSWK